MGFTRALVVPEARPIATEARAVVTEASVATKGSACVIKPTACTRPVAIAAARAYFLYALFDQLFSMLDVRTLRNGCT